MILEFVSVRIRSISIPSHELELFFSPSYSNQLCYLPYNLDPTKTETHKSLNVSICLNKTKKLEKY
jgi:hypothetical protein